MQKSHLQNTEISISPYTKGLSDASLMRLSNEKKAATERLHGAESHILADLISTMKAPRRQECRLATINANGLRRPSKKEAVALFLYDFSISIRVVSETHLREEDINTTKKYFLDFLLWRIGK